jgi:two-component system, LytTR family, response regulator
VLFWASANILAPLFPNYFASDMKCLIIDDDPLMRDMISHFAGKVDFIEYCIQCSSATDALNLLAGQSFDLIFLDLEMPEISGMELLRHLKVSVPIIIITANPDFALESYEYQVVDYLLKPVTFPRFYKAVQKAQQAEKSGPVAVKPEEIFIKDGHNLVKLVLQEVLYIEAVSNYVSFKTTGKAYLALMSLQKLEESLPENFVRIHRSFMVNIKRIDRVEGNNLFIGNTSLPISNSYKDKLLKKLNLLT